MTTTNNQSSANVPSLSTVSLAISSGQTSASSGDLKGRSIVGIITPASLASTSLTFTVSDDGTTFRTLVNVSNASITVTVDSTTRQYAFDPQIFVGVRYIKVISGSSETSKTFKLVVRPLA